MSRTILLLIFQLVPIQDLVYYPMTSSMVSQGACLDNNHSHFILVDDGTVEKYGGEITFRACLEHCISNKKISRSKYFVLWTVI